VLGNIEKLEPRVGVGERNLLVFGARNGGSFVCMRCVREY